MSGQFVWFDLFTPDPAAAKYYTEVVGWTLTPFAGDYEMFTGGEGPIGGLEASEDGAPHWLAYVSVPDVDASFGAALAAGATARQAPEDIPVGRAAILEDPHGAVFALFTSADPPAGSPEAPQGLRPPGHIAWRELMSGGLDKAWGFYTGLFDWSQSGSMDMGEMGEYRLFMAGPQGGGMMNAPQGMSPHWLYYFNVDDLDAAVERATAAGGRLNQGPMEVPGGDRVALFSDPQGAEFALHEYGAASKEQLGGG